MLVYYNEIDQFTVRWLHGLIKKKLLPDGVVDGRSIEEVQPHELSKYTQCHFFAGIGGWPYALQLAGWPRDRRIWTGSCPCQPFSVAGHGRGFTDDRHLWPAWFRLIRQCSPPLPWLIGEQVASQDALTWLDLVFSDLESAGYACEAVDLCAAGFGAPHIRQRLYWCAYPLQTLDTGRSVGDVNGDSVWTRGEEYSVGSLGNTCRFGRRDSYEKGEHNQQGKTVFQTARCGATEQVMPTNGYWQNPDWVWCDDKKWRPIESGTVPLANGISKGMGRMCHRDLCFKNRIKAYGNAIVIPQAVEFIRACMELMNDTRSESETGSQEDS